MDTPRKKYEEADRALKTDFWSVFWLVPPHIHAWASSPDQRGNGTNQNYAEFPTSYWMMRGLTWPSEAGEQTC